MPIDLNRGVTSRRQRADTPWIHMYKDQPGVYYEESGDLMEGDDALEKAAAAGFDVVEHAKAKRRTELLEEQRAEIEARVEKEFTEKIKAAEGDIEKKFAKRIEREEQAAGRRAAPAAQKPAATPPRKEEGA